MKKTHYTMKQKEAAEIATTIKHQLCYGSNQTKVWSWGAHAWKFGLIVRLTEGRDDAYLRFRVKGFKLKGVVQIAYNMGADTYYINFYNANDTVPFKTLDNVYFDEMTDIIDRQVETDNDQSADYAAKVKQAAIVTFIGEEGEDDDEEPVDKTDVFFCRLTDERRCTKRGRTLRPLLNQKFTHNVKRSIHFKVRSQRSISKRHNSSGRQR